MIHIFSRDNWKLTLWVGLGLIKVWWVAKKGFLDHTNKQNLLDDIKKRDDRSFPAVEQQHVQDTPIRIVILVKGKVLEEESM